MAAAAASAAGPDLDGAGELGPQRLEGLAQAWVFVVFAGILAAALPLIPRVPEQHGSW